MVTPITSSLREDLSRHPEARLDRTFHPTWPDAVVRVLAREEHPSIEWRRDQREHRVSLVADRRSDHCTRPGVARPTLDVTEDALDRPPDHRAHGGIDLVQGLVVRESGRFGVARRPPR